MNTCLNETSVHMCLEPGEELFKAINYGGKDEHFLYTSVWLYGRQKRYYAPFMGYKFIAYLCP